MSNSNNKNQDNSFNELDAFIQNLLSVSDNAAHKRGVLIQSLHKAQELFGYLPPKVQDFIAKKLDISPAKVFGVVSFYSFFTMEPKGDFVINVCMGTACYVRGADKVLTEFENLLKIKSGQTTPDGKFSLSSLRCVGACGLAPVVMVNGDVFGKIKPDEVKNIIGKYNNISGQN